MIHKLFEIFVFRAVYPQFLWRDVEHDKILVSFCVSAERLCENDSDTRRCSISAENSDFFGMQDKVERVSVHLLKIIFGRHVDFSDLAVTRTSP